MLSECFSCAGGMWLRHLELNLQAVGEIVVDDFAHQTAHQAATLPGVEGILHVSELTQGSLKMLSVNGLVAQDETIWNSGIW